LHLCRYNHITTHFSVFLSPLKWPPAIPAFPPVSLPCRRTTCSSLCCGSSSRCSQCSRCCGNPLRKNKRQVINVCLSEMPFIALRPLPWIFQHTFSFLCGLFVYMWHNQRCSPFCILAFLTHLYARLSIKAAQMTK